MVPFLVRLLVEDCNCCIIVLFYRVLDVDTSTLLLQFGTFITIAGIRLGCDDGKLWSKQSHRLEGGRL
jgi:hypothetical protein